MRLAYKTYGTLNARKDNVIVYPTSFSAQHYDTEWLIQQSRELKKAGVPVLHYYTLGKPKVIEAVVKATL